MKKLLVQGMSIGMGLAALAVFAGCSSGQTKDGATSGDGMTKPPTGSATYYRDVKAIVDDKCAGCHTEGGIAPFPLTSFEDVREHKSAIGAAVSSGEMPPWPPAASCGEYQDNRSLSKEQIAAITGWIEDGAAEGDPAEAPVAEKPKSGLSRVDLTLAMPEAYTPTVSPDEYRCFIIDWPATDTTYVTGFGVAPGAPAIVHHLIAYLATPDKLADYEALDAADPAPGYTCFGGPGGAASFASWIGAWVPGAEGTDFPAGTGIEIPPGSKVVVQLHYNTLSASPRPDQSKLLIKTDAMVDKRAAVLPWTNLEWVLNKKMSIPAHMEDVTHQFAFDPSLYLGQISGGVLANNQPFTLYSAGLHMHTRGTRAVTSIKRQSGDEECLLDIERWNFHWQGSYRFTAPKQFNPGDELSLECHWDNTGATDLNWGEGTGDEMCLGTYYVTE